MRRRGLSQPRQSPPELRYHGSADGEARASVKRRRREDGGPHEQTQIEGTATLLRSNDSRQRHVEPNSCRMSNPLPSVNDIRSPMKLSNTAAPSLEQTCSALTKSRVRSSRPHATHKVKSFTQPSPVAKYSFPPPHSSIAPVARSNLEASSPAKLIRKLPIEIYPPKPATTAFSYNPRQFTAPLRGQQTSKHFLHNINNHKSLTNISKNNDDDDNNNNNRLHLHLQQRAQTATIARQTTTTSPSKPEFPIENMNPSIAQGTLGYYPSHRHEYLVPHLQRTAGTAELVPSRSGRRQQQGRSFDHYHPLPPPLPPPPPIYSALTYPATRVTTTTPLRTFASPRGLAGISNHARSSRMPFPSWEHSR